MLGVLSTFQLNICKHGKTTKPTTKETTAKSPSKSARTWIYYENTLYNLLSYKTTILLQNHNSFVLTYLLCYWRFHWAQWAKRRMVTFHWYQNMEGK